MFILILKDLSLANKDSDFFFSLPVSLGLINCYLMAETLSTRHFRLLMNLIARFYIISTLLMLVRVAKKVWKSETMQSA